MEPSKASMIYETPTSGTVLSFKVWITSAMNFLSLKPIAVNGVLYRNSNCVLLPNSSQTSNPAFSQLPLRVINKIACRLRPVLCTSSALSLVRVLSRYSMKLGHWTLKNGLARRYVLPLTPKLNSCGFITIPQTLTRANSFTSSSTLWLIRLSRWILPLTIPGRRSGLLLKNRRRYVSTMCCN